MTSIDLHELNLKSLWIADKAHKGQKDKAGKEYIFHPMRVADALANDKSLSLRDRTEGAIAGMLHDVVEGTDITIDYLREQGFPENILFAIDCLTRREGENYQDFIVRCCQSKIAMRVKIADLDDNLDVRRLKHITEKDIERINRYLEARRYICNMLAYSENP